MPPSNITLEAVIGIIAIGQAAMAMIFWAFRAKMKQEMAEMEGRLLVHMDTAYVRSNECVLRDGATRQIVSETRAEVSASCLASIGRDEATQLRINELIQAIASRAADTIMRDQQILSKIDALLSRKY